MNELQDKNQGCLLATYFVTAVVTDRRMQAKNRSSIFWIFALPVHKVDNREKSKVEPQDCKRKIDVKGDLAICGKYGEYSRYCKSRLKDECSGNDTFLCNRFFTGE